MGDTTDGSSIAAQSAQLTSENKSNGFFRRLFKSSAQNRPQALPPLNSSPSIGFRKLKSMRVEDVAIPRADIVSAASDMALSDIIAEFSKSGYSRLPIYSDNLDNPVGMVHLKDIALKYGFNGKGRSFSIEKLLRPVLFVPPSMPLDVLLQKMQTERTHLALVVDEYGGVDGLVSIEDLIEQLVGDISDEHDVQDVAEWVETDPGIYVCQARASLADFEQVLGVDLASDTDDEDIDTLGGLACVMTGRVPVRGEVISHPAGYDFEILEADPRRIKKIRVCKRG
ncbi:conjugation transfer protein [Amylibacter marinus]|uniref:Conjugation transfer protein n=1 Tax=Amylibacter marinus TaxID=1475483 RepID=A0ABQ5VQX1_9RHOB|nr:hemolysin family protein [Amylibacter marinus]GLQ33744.1 conjugation transfer protein [Amylibacter marinus]